MVSTTSPQSPCRWTWQTRSGSAAEGPIDHLVRGRRWTPGLNRDLRRHHRARLVGAGCQMSVADGRNDRGCQAHSSDQRAGRRLNGRCRFSEARETCVGFGAERRGTLPDRLAGWLRCTGLHRWRCGTDGWPGGGGDSDPDCFRTEFGVGCSAASTGDSRPGRQDGDDVPIAALVRLSHWPGDRGTTGCSGEWSSTDSERLRELLRSVGAEVMPGLTPAWRRMGAAVAKSSIAAGVEPSFLYSPALARRCLRYSVLMWPKTRRSGYGTATATRGWPGLSVEKQP